MARQKGLEDDVIRQQALYYEKQPEYSFGNPDRDGGYHHNDWDTGGSSDVNVERNIIEHEAEKRFRKNPYKTPWEHERDIERERSDRK